jgi:hypothetical protein
VVLRKALVIINSIAYDLGFKTMIKLSRVIGWGTTLQAGRSRASRPNEAITICLNLANLSSRADPGVYSAWKENEYQKQKKKFLGSRARPAHKSDNLTTICVPIV